MIKKLYLHKSLYHLSRHNTEKMNLLLDSVDSATKNAKTANDMIDDLFKWAYNYHNVFSNSHQVITDALRNSNLTLKNGNMILDNKLSKDYRIVKMSKLAISSLVEVNDFGDVLTFAKQIKNTLEHSHWYFKLPPLSAMNTYATPANLNSAKRLVIGAKNNICNTMDLIDPHTELKKAEAKAMTK